ncbi:fungal specific transcription factor domain-containing protein, partial [Staphylococcus aureus]|nr:fungal specific transcription factor domain-containing protein [Staphylococcus aureus]
ESNSPLASTVNQPTMMTYAIHAFHIRSLQGRTQTQIYSDTTLQDPEIRESRINKLSDMLEDWKSSLPPTRAP